MRDLLPGVMIQEITPGVSMIVRLSGTAINAAFGRDLTGWDLIAMSPDGARTERLARNSDVAKGAIALGVRRRTTRLGHETESQEIQLPFGDVTADGARQILFHTSWRPENAQPGVAEVGDVLRLAESFDTVSLSQD